MPVQQLCPALTVLAQLEPAKYKHKLSQTALPTIEGIVRW
jgi:hypothetical protein